MTGLLALTAMDSGEDPTTKSLQKRYESLVSVRSKAINGKGAWYWFHLEPILIHNTDTGTAKAVKLRCNLCQSIFSASNPSRTASEHLKRGTCPNFNPSSKPISAISPPMKRSAAVASSSYHAPPPLAMMDPSRHLVLSGGKDDLNALAMLEDSVKKLKSPKFSPGPALNKSQIDSAVNYLVDWFYESCGAVSLSAIENPKFRGFLQQLGIPPIGRVLSGDRLDTKYDEARIQSEVKMSEALFFQVASEGWKKIKNGGEDNVVNITVNLPNGTSVFRRALFFTSRVPANYAEEVMWETVIGICRDRNIERCVGIVSDKFKAKALRNLEHSHNWMVNLSCQFQGFLSLIKDFSRELPFFKKVAENCWKIGNFINSEDRVRNIFLRYQLQEFAHARLLRVASEPDNCRTRYPFNVFTMLEDILSSSRTIKLTVTDEQFKNLCIDDPIAVDIAKIIANIGFWRELEAAYSLVKLINAMAEEIEQERPLVGQCLPLWEELRTKIKGWCTKFNIADEPAEQIIQKRFEKTYHPAWSAAFILDPLYLLRDSSGKYLPPFKYLTPEQEKDVDKLITRLVSQEEAHIALMELMKWRSDGLDPIYAQAVQEKQMDPLTGKMKVVNPQSSRLVWETYLSEFKSLAKVAVRLIFLNSTSCGYTCNRSFVRWVHTHCRTRMGMERAEKMVFIAAQAKLERRDFSNEEDKDAEIWSRGEDEDLNEIFLDPSSV